MNEDHSFLKSWNAESAEPEKKPDEAPAAPVASEPSANINPTDAAEVAATQKTKAPTDGAHFSLPKMSVPASIAAVLMFILFIVFAITPANGKDGPTRLQLIWGVISRGGGLRGLSFANINPHSTSYEDNHSGLTDPGSLTDDANGDGISGNALGLDEDLMPSPHSYWNPQTGRFENQPLT